jgi:predicted MPP superfamily phosphohydrolase
MQTKVSRRKFLTLGAGALLGAAFVATPTYLHLQDESRQLVVERVQIPIRNLSPALEGFTIVQLSDIHLEPYTKADLIRQAVEIANSLQPGLVVLTGDYVWRKLEAIFDLTPILARLNAQHGVFSIMGNHDIWTDVNVVRTAFQEQGLPVLENQGVPLTVNRAPLYLAGLDDGWSGQPDLEAALDGAPAGAPVVLLLHEPDLADAVSLDGRVSLQLAGHSHGGQIRFPGIGALVLPYLGRKYDLGLYRVNEMWLYTNRGIGATTEPVRYNCPPEITQITLVGA